MLEMGRHAVSFLHDHNPPVAFWAPSPFVWIAGESVRYGHSAPVPFPILVAEDFNFRVLIHGTSVANQTDTLPNFAMRDNKRDMKNRLVSVTEFKAKYSAFLDEAERGGSITILKYGRPVGVVGPAPRARKATAVKAKK